MGKRDRDVRRIRNFQVCIEQMVGWEQEASVKDSTTILLSEMVFDNLEKFPFKMMFSACDNLAHSSGQEPAPASCESVQLHRSNDRVHADGSCM